MTKIFYSRGFTLIELMASLGIMSIISLNVATMIKNQEMGVVKTRAEYSMSGTIVELGSMLAKSDVCSNIASGLGGKGPTTAPLSILTISNGTRTFTANADFNTATFYGDGNIAIHSFSVPADSWQTVAATAPATGYRGTAALLVNFYRKGAPTQFVTKKLNLIINSNDNITITSCQSLGYVDSTLIGSGIISCPSSMLQIGNAGDRSTFCIDNAPRAAANYTAANTTCFAKVEERLGSAHLCNFNEWSTACLANAGALTMDQANTPYEWISAAPTTTATLTLASTMTVIGAKVSTFSACSTVNVNAIGTDVYPFRCCFH